MQLGKEGLRAYAFSLDGRLLISGTNYPQQIQIWDISNGNLLHEVVSTTHQGAAVFSPMDNQVAIWGLNGAEFWQPGHDKAPVKFSEIAPDSSVDQGERIMSIVFDQLGKRALIVGEYHTYIWDFESSKLLATIEQYLLSNAQFLPDGSHFLAGVDSIGSDDRHPFLGIWSIADGKLIAKIPTNGDISSIEQSADRTRIATGTESSIAQVWDLEWMQLFGNAKALQQHVCNRHFVGARAYSSEELADPILRGQTSLAAPCDRRGPLSLQYWAQFLSSSATTPVAQPHAPADAHSAPH
jgi:WD40 repeat protein